MSTVESKKRKREAEPPRITFSAPSRTFERLLKETSLDALRSNIVKKLGIDVKTPVEFTQVRAGRYIDLEDEDDFAAFKSYAMSNGVAEVRIRLSTSGSGVSWQGQTSDGVGNGRTAPAQPPTAGPSTTETSDETSNPQTDKVAGFQDVPNVSVEPSQKKASRKRNTKRAPVPTIEASAGAVLEVRKNSTKSRTSKSKDAHSTPLAAEPEGHGDPTTKHIESTRDQGDSVAAAEPQFATRLEPSKTGKDKKEKEIKPKKKAGQASVTFKEPPGDKANDATEPSSALPASFVVSVPTSEVLASEAPQEPKAKKRKSRKQQATEPVKLADGNQEQSRTESSTTPLPPTMEVQQREHPVVAQADASSTSRDTSKSKKRKLDTAEKSRLQDASEPGKPKKRKATDAPSTVSFQAVEPESAAPPPDVAMTDVKSKTTKGKKRKPTPEELTRYDEALDSVVATVIAKRVNGSSKQTTPTLPMPTVAYSAPTKQLHMEHPENSTEVDTGALAAGKSKIKRSKKTSTEDTIPKLAPSIDEQPSVSSHPQAETNVNALTQREKASQKRADDRIPHEAAQQGQPDPTVVNASPNVEKTTATKRPSRSTTAKKVESGGNVALASRSKDLTNRRTGKLKTTVKDQEVNKKMASTSTSKDAKQTSATGFPPLVPPGSNVSVVVIEGKDEGSSSDSSSDSGSSDSDDGDSMETAVPSKTNKKSPTTPSGGIAYPAPSSSLAIGSVEKDDSMDIDSLLHPEGNNVSWQKVTRLAENDGDDKVERMSDVEEEEEEERPKKVPRSSLQTKYVHSSSDDDDDEGVGLGAVDFEVKTTISRSEIPAAHEELDRPFPRKVISAEQENEACRQKATSPRSAMETAGFESDSSRPGSTQAQHSPPSPSLKEINARAESVLTEHVADSVVNRAMEEDGTLLLANVSLTNVARLATNTLAIDTRSPAITFAELPESQNGKTNNIGKDVSASAAAKKPAARDPAPAPLPVRAKKSASTAPIDAAATGPPLSEARALSQDSGIRGTVKRMKGRDGKRLEPSGPLSQPMLSINEEPSFTQSTPVNDRRRKSASQSSQKTAAGQRDTSQLAGSQQPRSTSQKKTTPPGKVSKEPAPAGSDVQAQSAAPPHSQTANSQSTRSTRKGRPSPAVISEPRPLSSHRVDKDNGITGFNNSSTTEVEKIPNDETRSLSEAPSKGRGRSTVLSIPSPAPTGESEEVASESDDERRLIQQSQIHSSRPSVVGLRSLTSIASNSKLFSPASTPKSTYGLSPATFRSQAPIEDGDGGGNDDDSDDDSSSDSGSDNSSAIPKDRRAGGVAARANKSHNLNRLLSFV